MKRAETNLSPMSRWLAEPQREGPWNGIGSLRVISSGASATAEDGKTKLEQDSEHATKGSTVDAHWEVSLFDGGNGDPNHWFHASDL